MRSFRINSSFPGAKCTRGVPSIFHSVTKGGSAVVTLLLRFGGAVASGRIFKLSFVLGLALIAAACAGGGDTASDVTLPAVDESVPVEASSTTEAPTSTTEAPTTPTTSTAPVEAASSDEAMAAWVSAWQTASQIEIDEAAVEAFATPEVASGLKQVLTGGGSSRLVTNFPALSDPDSNGVIVVHDCLFVSPPIIDSLTSWYRGEITVSESGEAVVSSFELEASGCVPETLSNQIIPDFLEARALEAQFFSSDVPDPSILTPGVSGARLQFLTDLANGVLQNEDVRGLVEIEWNPVVMTVQSVTQVEVGACYVVPQSHGAFDRTTGQRTGLIPPLSPNQRDAETSTMTLVEGVWTISDNGGVTNIDCDLESTPQRLPIVGVGGDRAALEES